MGVAVPNIRKVAKKASGLALDVVEMLLESQWHESRMCALLILIEKYRKNKQVVIFKSREEADDFLRNML